MAAASGLEQEFRIVLPSKVKVKNSTISVYPRPFIFFNNSKFPRFLRKRQVGETSWNFELSIKSADLSGFNVFLN